MYHLIRLVRRLLAFAAVIGCVALVYADVMAPFPAIASCLVAYVAISLPLIGPERRLALKCLTDGRCPLCSGDVRHCAKPTDEVVYYCIPCMTGFTERGRAISSKDEKDRPD